MINAETILCASIAYPNRATKSPGMHNAGLEALGLNFVYVAFEPIDLAGAIQGMRALGIRGFSVSKPYKSEVIALLDRIDPIARAIGAVNTILNDNGVLIGYNSDWIGAISALKEKEEIHNKKAVIVGAGGVARAIAFGLKEEGAQVSIVNRTSERAQELAVDLGVDYGGSLDVLETDASFDIVVNATSVGFYPNIQDSIVPLGLLKPGTLVLDVVFNPHETALLRQAANRGCKVVYGTRMLVLQGAFQFKLFTGKEAPVSVMDNFLEKAFREIQA